MEFQHESWDELWNQGGSKAGATIQPNASPSQQSSQNQSSEETANDQTEDSKTPVEEEEEQEQEPLLVTLSNPVFLDLEDQIFIDKPANIQVDVTYETERRPREITFQIHGVFEGETESSIVTTGTIDSDNKAQTTITIPQHMTFYHKENKTDTDKISYTFKAMCPADNSEIESEELLLPKKIFTVDTIEYPKHIFHAESAVPFLDEDGELIHFLVACFLHANEHPDKKIVRAQHPETSDDPEIALFEKRINAMTALSLNTLSDVTSLAQNDGTLLDFKQSLKTLSIKYGWECNPGDVNESEDSETSNAIEQFQKTFNTLYSKSITVSGSLEKETWEALFSVIYTTAFDIAQTSDFFDD
ncbi:MAG: hypothetical protein OCD76_09555 [Reichenbachiella sp.]